MTSITKLVLATGLILSSTVGSVAFGQPAATSKILSINWYHGAENLRPVIAEFTRETGIPVNVTDDYDTFTTDVIMVSDFKNLTETRKLAKFQKLNSAYAEKVVPARWRDRRGYWTGVMLRTRVVIYDKRLFRGGGYPTAWQDLADPKWRGKLTLRSASNVYNRSLLALMVHHRGEATALSWATAVAANAGPKAVFNGDTSNAELVGGGKFPLSLINSYYLGYMLNGGGDDAKVVGNVGVSWMEQQPGGTGQPVNVTGAGINADTDQPEAARRLIEWLITEKGQALLSQHVYKYPVRDDVKPSPYLASFGSFKADQTDLNELEFLYDRVDQIFEKAGWAAEW